MAGQVLLFASFALAYFAIRSLTEGSADQAFANAQRLMDLEAQLGLAVEDELQSLIIDNSTLVTLANWVYVWLHWPFIAASAVYLALRHRNGYRSIRNAVFVSGAIGIVIFAIFPVMPPRLAMQGLADTVTEHSHAYRVLQPPEFTNQYAAMPSLHFGWNLLVGIGLWCYAKPMWIRAMGIVAPFAMLWAVILTANHYIVDPIAGGALALFGLVAATRGRRARRRGARRLASVARRSS